MVGRSVVVAVALMFSFATSSLGAFVAIRPIRFVGDTKVVTFAKRKRQSRQRPIAEVSAPELLVVGNDVHVDMERARQCAEVFGHCSVEEMEHLKSELHKERVQNLIFGSSYRGISPTSSVVDIASHRVLEEELDLQLSLLKEHTPDLFLFPDEKEEIMKVLPNLHSDKQKDNEGVFHAPTPAEVIAFETTVLEENVLEPFLMCMVIVALAALPQLLN